MAFTCVALGTWSTDAMAICRALGGNWSVMAKVRGSYWSVMAKVRGSYWSVMARARIRVKTGHRGQGFGSAYLFTDNTFAKNPHGATDLGHVPTKLGALLVVDPVHDRQPVVAIAPFAGIHKSLLTTVQPGR